MGKYDDMMIPYYVLVYPDKMDCPECCEPMVFHKEYHFRYFRYFRCPECYTLVFDALSEKEYDPRSIRPK